LDEIHQSWEPARRIIEQVLQEHPPTHPWPCPAENAEVSP
jgi:hypothetical protein